MMYALFCMNKYAQIYVEEFNKQASLVSMAKSLGRGLAKETDWGQAASHFGSGLKHTFGRLASKDTPILQRLNEFFTNGIRGSKSFLKGDKAVEGIARADQAAKELREVTMHGRPLQNVAEAEKAILSDAKEMRMARNSVYAPVMMGAVAAPASVVGTAGLAGLGTAYAGGAFDAPKPPPTLLEKLFGSKK